VGETLAIVGSLPVLLLGGGLSLRLEIRGVLILGERHIHDADSKSRIMRNDSLCLRAACCKGLRLNGLETRH